MPENFLVPLELSRNSEDQTITNELIKPLKYEVVPATDRDAGKTAQKRFAGCYMAKPDIKLSRYKCRAEIDWVWMEFEVGSSRITGKEAQSSRISERLGPILGTKPWVTGPDVWVYADTALNYQGQKFRIKIQSPTPKNLLKVRDRIDEEWPITLAMRIIGIEVSLDWRSRAQSNQERLEMVAALQRHLYIDDIALGGASGDLRYTYNHPYPEDLKEGDKDWKSEFVIKKHRLLNGAALTLDTSAKLNSANKRLLLKDSDRDFKDPEMLSVLHRENSIKSAFLDSTVYLGEAEGNIKFRIQNKLKDGRNSKTEPVKVLEPKDRRARLEVTLLNGAVQKYGFGELEELYDYGFEQLASKLFGLWLPTFPDAEEYKRTMPDVLKKARGSQQKQVFIQGGIYAHEVWEGVGHQNRNRSKVKWRQEGLETSKPVRVGRGTTGTRVSWVELTDQCRDALYNMSRRWSSTLLLGSGVDEK